LFLLFIKSDNLIQAGFVQDMGTIVHKDRCKQENGVVNNIKEKRIFVSRADPKICIGRVVPLPPTMALSVICRCCYLWTTF
jgi:hypothetical protein